MDANMPLQPLTLPLAIDLNAADKDGDTALACAAMNGHTEAVRMLIEAGAGVFGCGSVKLISFYKKLP